MLIIFFLSQSHSTIAIMISNKQADVFIKLSINILTEKDQLRDHNIMRKFVNVSCLSPMHCLHYFIFICLMYHCPVILYCEAFYYFLQLVLTFFILSDFAQSSVLNSTHLPSGTPLTTIYHSSSLATSGSSAFLSPWLLISLRFPITVFESAPCTFRTVYTRYTFQRFADSFQGPTEPCRA